MKNAKGIPVIGYVFLVGWPFMVGWSRMWDNRNYLWNVMLGLAIGFSSGYAVVKSHDVQIKL